MAEPREAGRAVRDQIARYRTAFIAVVTMILIAVFVGGYVLAHERLSLPSWVPFVGSSNFVLNAEFQTGQALAPGQGQAITIAGAKIGEIAEVKLRNGVALVKMDVEPRQARHIYRNATLLMRPKTQLKDMTIQIDQGSPSAGRVHEGETFDLAQTAPDMNFDQLLASLDKETRIALQQLLAGAGIALKGNGTALSGVFRRFYPTTLDIERITHELKDYQLNIRRSIHNFQLLMSELGGKDRQVAEVVESADRSLGVFAAEEKAVRRTLAELPGALEKTKAGLGKLGEAAAVVGPTLTKLHRFATSLAPALKASKRLFEKTAPILKNEVEQFVHQVAPVLKKVAPTTKSFNESLPPLTTSFSVLNEFFNELAYNAGPKRGSFLFFLLWASHDFNSALSTADANGPLGRTVLYFDCEIASIIPGVAETNPNVGVLVGLLQPPTRQECEAHKLAVTATGAGASAASAHSSRASARGAHASTASAHGSRSSTASAGRTRGKG